VGFLLVAFSRLRNIFSVSHEKKYSHRKQGQYVDGLRAPLIIHPPEEHYSYDGEYTVILGDWYHDEHGPLLNKFLSVANPGGAEPVPSARCLLLLIFPWH
jgi:hypothetical protein